MPVIRDGLRLRLVGVVLDLAGAAGLARYLSSMLLEISFVDPLTIVALTALLIAVAPLASYIPARRGTRVDPTVALRYE